MIQYGQTRNKSQNRASVQIWTDFENCKSEGAMKHDLTKPLTRGARRTLEAFRSEMFALLSKKAFEEITVGEPFSNASGQSLKIIRIWPIITVIPCFLCGSGQQ